MSAGDPPAPLAGIRVVDLSQNLAGPFCSRILADMGADVVKVERPGGGDSSRQWGPPFWGGESPIFLASNTGKRSVVADLKHPGGREVVLRLAAGADIFLESFRAGVADDLGVGVDAVRADNPGLIYASVTAFGEEGPLRELPGFDPLMQASAGIMSVTGEPGGEPVRVGTSLVDMGTGMWAALAILGALRIRERTGEAPRVTTALYDTALGWMGYHVLGYLGAGRVPERLGTGLGMIAPYEAFPTADGRLMIAAGTDALFRRLCGALGRSELAEDERFRDNPSRVRNRELLVGRLGEATARHSTEALLSRLREAGVPCAPIRDVAGVWEAPQTEAAEMFPAMESREAGALRGVALPFRWDGRRPPLAGPSPAPGADTEEILREAGFTDDEIAALRARGAVPHD